MLAEFAQFLVESVFSWGYLGIFLLMAIESSFIPFPSEVVLIPAGYLISQDKMDASFVFVSALAGSLVGAFINYFLAYFVGRAFLEKFGKYFFISQATLRKMDSFFEKHGAISTFTGRLVPGIRQLISIPAGLARMRLATFGFYTALGAGLWALVLIALGYFLGENQALIKIYLKEITITVFIGIVILVAIYYVIGKRRG